MTKTTLGDFGSDSMVHRASPGIVTLLCCLITQTAPVWGQPPGEQPMASVESIDLVAARLTPKSLEASRSLLVVTIGSSGLSNVTLRLTSPAWPQPAVKSLATLNSGRQTVEVEVPLLKASTAVTVRVETPTEKRDFGPLTLQPPPKWTVYLAQHTHTDIGYTRPQTEILPEHLRYIDYALDYCDLTDGYPDDARFRWTCETSWAVREYLKGRSAKQIERLRKRVNEGRIEICGLMLNMSEIATESSLAALLRPIREMKEKFGFSVRTAMQNDVNGAGWCLVDYFNGHQQNAFDLAVRQADDVLVGVAVGETRAGLSGRPLPSRQHVENPGRKS
jgi:hypothetical protein